MDATVKCLNFTNSPDSYLTGMLALNIPSPDGALTGDWHKGDAIMTADASSLDVFRAGGERFPDTSSFFGSDGIYDYAPTLRKRGFEPTGPVFMANHFRAIVDLVITWYLRGTVPAPVPFADFFPFPEHRRMFFNFLNVRARSFAPGLRSVFAQWLREDRRIEEAKWHNDDA
jgi:hypothetical protein